MGAYDSASINGSQTIAPTARPRSSPSLLAPRIPSFPPPRSDVVVNNAGVASVLFANTAKVLAVNTVAVAEGAELALKWATDGLAHRASRPVLVVNTASVAGLMPSPVSARAAAWGVWVPGEVDFRQMLACA